MIPSGRVFHPAGRPGPGIRSVARQDPDQVFCRATAVQKLLDVISRSAKRFEGWDPLERVPAREVEDHRVPGGRGDVVGVLLQAAASE